METDAHQYLKNPTAKRKVHVCDRFRVCMYEEKKKNKNNNNNEERGDQCVHRSAATNDGITRYERTSPEMSIVTDQTAAVAVCDAILENHYMHGGRARCCYALAAAATRWCRYSLVPTRPTHRCRPCRPACAAVCRVPSLANGFIIIILFRRVYAHSFVASAGNAHAFRTRPDPSEFRFRNSFFLLSVLYIGTYNTRSTHVHYLPRPCVSGFSICTYLDLNLYT